MREKADYSLDFRDVIAPLNLLKAARKFREMAPNQILEIWSGDPNTRMDLLKMFALLPHELLSAEEQDGDGVTYRIRLIKK